MYLKSIEVQGFKSFAHKIKFDFHPGITAIVGPNGCGKSNVADAVRWVLGEQRVHQLRGDSMQDVIFSGTENRKPLSYASVSITLDNSDHKLPIDYGEVTVTRRLYRSGESEYLLNGTACRLRDVNELFYDTGIGKEGYSIIGQGQIDAILSGKPEERRELFDEAAGIVKYKRRKEVSLKKLDDEEQNLARVNDILEELSRQMEPLKEQSDIARTYLNKKEELKIYDINMFLLEMNRLKNQGASIEQKLLNAREELESANHDYADMKKEYESVEEQVDEIDAAIERVKGQQNETSLLKQQLESQIALLQEQIHSARMNDEHYSKRLDVVQEELRLRDEQQKSQEEEQARCREELDKVRFQESSAREELISVQTRIATLQSEVETDKNDIMDLLGSRASTKAKIQKYDTMLEQTRFRQEQLAKRKVEAQKNEQDEQALYEKYQGELKEISDKLISLSDENDALEEKINGLSEQARRQESELLKVQGDYHRESSRLESLKNIAERYEGYGNSVRKVMDNKGKEKGLLGVVADLIRADASYETAIEIALGGSISNIVTEDEETAKRMISFLKEGRYGRATFLPLSSIKTDQSLRYPEALNEPGVIGTADSLVEVKEKYKGLARYLLGRTLVADTIDTAVSLAKKYHQSLRIVTLEGELISPGGSISGGAYKNSGNLLGRRREIEELEAQVQQLAENRKTAQEINDALKKEQNSAQKQLDELRKKQQDAFVTQNTAKLNLDQAKAGVKNAHDRLEDILHEENDIEDEIRDIGDNQESIRVELDTSETLEKELNQKAEKAQRELDEIRESESGQLKKTEEIQVQRAALEQKEEFASSNLTRILDEREKFQEELEELQENQGGASKDIQDKEKEIEDLRLTIDNSGELMEEIQREIEKYKGEREDLSRRNKDFLQKREDLSGHISELDKEVYRLESQRTNNEDSQEKQINYMWEEYELTYKQAQEMRDENLTDLNKMKRQIQTLKGEIRDLGDVNVNAIEDYKNLSERYTFLSGQHDDLVEASESLKKIIQDLDEAMRRQFAEQFDLIAKEFNSVFKELYGGGKGTLSLTDDEDILEAGIVINAQPPGKKLQNMMQLSGGEKALTAIALLFAIQNLKPSPFCLLDEIEAALDDNNVDRFANYLKKLSKYTQFIVITHRRGTMNAADRLYGITMQEKGVSTLVSVSLLENDLTD